MLLEARAIRAMGVNCIPPALVTPALQVHLPPSCQLAAERPFGGRCGLHGHRCMALTSRSKNQAFLCPTSKSRKHAAFLS